MRQLTTCIFCTIGLLSALARGEAQTPAFIDANGDGINDAYQGIHRVRGRMRGKPDWFTALAKVKLTEEQRARLQQTSLDYRKTVAPLNTALGEAQARLREVMQSVQPDQKAIDAQVDAVNALRTQVQKATAAYQSTVQGILTPEQWTALNVAVKGQGVPRPAPGLEEKRGGEDIFVDEDGDGICDGRGVSRRVVGPAGPRRPGASPQHGRGHPEQ